MKRPRNTLALLVVAAVAVSGCYTMEIDATPLQPTVLMTGPTGGQQTLGQFNERTTGSWLFWGLLPLSPPNVSEVVDREIRRLNGAGVTSVEITTQQTVLDALLSMLTLGIYGQRTTLVRGTVVR
jgi:hypothetical protein